MVTTLKRQATKILADYHASTEPVLITEHGQPSACLVDVNYYEFMQQRMLILEGLTRGEQLSNGENRALAQISQFEQKQFSMINNGKLQSCFSTTLTSFSVFSIL